MYYIIVEKFGDENSKKWKSYLQWRNLEFKTFDSIDKILSPNLFTPKEAKDWEHIDDNDFNLDLITNFTYAQQILKRYKNAKLVGIEKVNNKETYIEKNNFLGYDILDQKREISLLTNWGNDIEIINKYIGQNGLIKSLSKAKEIHSFLEKNYASDPHVMNCNIWAIYNPLDDEAL